MTTEVVTEVVNWHLRTQEATFFVATSILIYDYFLTINDEIQHVWKKKSGLLSVLFLFNRYFPLAAFSVLSLPVNSPHVCRLMSLYQGILTGLIVIIAEAMLIIRVHAVNLRKQWVLLVLVTVWIAQISLMGYALSYSGGILVTTSENTNRCIIDTSSKLCGFLYYFILPTLAFDFSAFLLTCVGLYRHIKYPTQLCTVSTSTNSSISTLILRDGLLYFLALCTVNTAWAITSSSLASDYQNLLGFPNSALTVVLMNRMVLHTRIYSIPQSSLPSINVRSTYSPATIFQPHSERAVHVG